MRIQLRTMKVYIVLMGKDLTYASKDYEDAQYEKETTEEENLLGRKLGVKLHEVEIDMNNLEQVFKYNGGVQITAREIVEFME